MKTCQCFEISAYRWKVWFKKNFFSIARKCEFRGKGIRTYEYDKKIFFTIWRILLFKIDLIMLNHVIVVILLIITLNYQCGDKKSRGTTLVYVTILPESLFHSMLNFHAKHCVDIYFAQRFGISVDSVVTSKSQSKNFYFF